MDNNFKASTAFGTADILLPAENTDMSKWAVVACDQFTSQPEYWKDAARIAEGAPSALDLILPEAYLESPDSEQMISDIRKNMEKYISDGIFKEYKNAMIYIERTDSTGKVRCGIIIPKRRSASLNATVFKTSAGAASWLPVARVANLGAAIDELKKNGIWIYGTDASGENYSDTSFTGPIGLVIGSEGFGMGRLIRDKCDFLVKLPMYGKITSLNASVAAGIFMYEAVRQRAAVK